MYMAFRFWPWFLLCFVATGHHGSTTTASRTVWWCLKDSLSMFTQFKTCQQVGTLRCGTI